MRKSFLIFIGLFLFSFSVYGATIDVSSTYTSERNTIVLAADRIIALQDAGGSWDWIVTNQAGPTGTTYLNIAGVTAEVLLDAYKLTGASKYLDAAKLAGDYLITEIGDPVSAAQRQNAFSMVFLYHLADISGDTQYSDQADTMLQHVLYEDNYWSNNNGNHCADDAVDGCTASELLDALKDYRSWASDPSGIVVWDLFHFIEAAQTGGEAAFATALASEIDTCMSQVGFDDTIDYYTLGLSAGIMGLGREGVDYSGYLTDLLSEQEGDGSFLNLGAEPVQTTAYALMALEYAGEFAAGSSASSYLVDTFGYSTYDGWLDDGDEYSEVTSEAAQAIFDYIYVPDTYYTIQDAINSANDGDTINVSDGTYNENVVVDKELTLQAGSSPVIDCSGTGDGVTISSDSVTIAGFEIRNCYNGITGETSFSVIKNNNIHDNLNVPGSAGVGILLWGNNDNNEILNNEIYDNDRQGIFVGYSDDTKISSGNTISGNSVYNNGLYTNPHGPDASAYGIQLWNADNNIVENNELYGHDDWFPSPGFDFAQGIYLCGSFDNEVNNNILHDNNYGVGLWDCGRTPGGTNTINFNDIYDNTGYGIRNFDSIVVDAEYNWWGSCDGPSFVGSGRGDNVTINVDYEPWLGICIENKIDVECNYSSDDIELSADVTGLDIDSVWFEVEVGGVRTNRTDVTNVGDRYFYILSSSELTGEEWIEWNVWANDTYDNEFNNGWKIFYVIKRTELSMNPTDPDGSDPWYITEPEFSLTKDIYEGITTYYRWDSTSDITYTAPFGLEDIPNPPTESAGTLELTYWTDFGACGNESEQSQTFYIDLTNTNITDLNPEDGSTVYNNLRPEISAYLDEVWQSNSGVDSITVIMEVDGSPVTPDINPADAIDYTVSYTPVSDLSLGPHNVYVYVEDNAGRVSELTWEFDIQTTTSFSMAVESPEDKVYGNRRIPIIVSLDSDVELLEYRDNGGRWRRLCRDCDGYDRTKSFREGEHELVIRATDEFGWTKEETINFEVDSRKPRISRIEPKRKSTINGENFKVKYTERNLNEVEVSLSDGVNVVTYGLIGCEAGRSKECSTSLDLSGYADGQWINYWFNVSDFVRTVPSRVYTVKVDTTDPILVVNEPNDVTYGGRRVPFDLEVTNEKVKVIEYQDNLGRWRRLCTRCDSYDRTKSFRRGSHIVNIRAIDYAGNFDQETINFNVDY